MLAAVEEFSIKSMTVMAGALFKVHEPAPAQYLLGDSVGFPGFIELIYLITRPELARTVSKQFRICDS